jgi:hydrogenase maturation protease
MRRKPVLVFGYGNPSRGDDAIGPEFLRLLEAERATGRVPDNFDTLTDFQLQIEHAADLEGRELVLFVDAAVSGTAPYSFSRLQAERAAGRVPDNFDTLTDFQLQIEHATDLEGRELVLFVDAAVSGAAPYSFSRLQAQRDEGISSHAISPANVLSVYEQVFSAEEGPAVFLLSIPGHDFELGHPMSEKGQEHLLKAREFVRQLLVSAEASTWSERAQA